MNKELLLLSLDVISTRRILDGGAQSEQEMLLWLCTALPALRLALPPVGVPAMRLAQPVMSADDVEAKQERDGASETKGGGASETKGGVVPTAPPPKTDNSVRVQGGSLKTWSYQSPSMEQVQIVLRTEGGPLDADVELWQGPDNSPCKIRVYAEDGQLYPFSAVMETPMGPNTVAVRNTGPVTFPLNANVVAEDVDNPPDEIVDASTNIQGGALRTFTCDPSVYSVDILLETDGRPLNARIEILQGPTNAKQVIELYTEDGRRWPFVCLLETPGAVNVIRVVNTASLEFPLYAAVLPYSNKPEMPSPPRGGYEDYPPRGREYEYEYDDRYPPRGRDW